MQVAWVPEARSELRAIPDRRERGAFRAVLERLEIYGDQLGYPDSSSVRGVDRLRELRPRAGRSAWWAFYRRVGDRIVIGAIGPEAEVDPRGFARATAAAEARLAREDRSGA